MRFTGTYFNTDDGLIPAQLTIRDGYISFNNWEDTWRYRIDTDNPQYYIGTDCSGGEYEKIRFDADWFRDWTIIGNGEYRQKHVTIQTWNRKQYFIDGCQEVKLCGKGKHKYYDRSSSTESTIINMSADSAEKLAALFDEIKGTSGIKVWR